MTAKKLIVGNWKMNLTIHEASLYVHKLAKQVKNHRSVEVVLAPSMLCLPTLSLQVERRQFKLAAQNLYWRDEGAFTGEVSAHQLRGLADYAIIGHSERRHIFGESDKDIRAKVQSAVRHGITPILCVGETAHERSDNETAAVLHDQIVAGVANLTSDELRQVVIAYEPVWAIGSGDNALPKDVEMVAGHIRRQVEHLYGNEIARNIRILYGGSVSPSNATGYLLADGIDGLLIGGASLRANDFSDMIEQAYKATAKG